MIVVYSNGAGTGPWDVVVLIGGKRMDDSSFWTIIARASADSEGDCEAFADCVHAQLVELPAAEIEAFHSIFTAKMSAAYSWKLWGAAYIIEGGCSDDAFEYFRCWLISQGRKVYEAAVSDPDSLTGVVDPDDDEHECEALLDSAMRAYEEVAGKVLPPPPNEGSPEPSGDPWDFDDAELTEKRLPKLSRRYDQGAD